MSTQGPLEVGDRVGDATVVQVAAGRGHTAALLADGRVVCWGENDHGQCAVPPDLGPAVQIAAGKEHTAALLSNGRVVCWGGNDRKQCAVPRDLDQAVQIAAGAWHTVALLADGRVVCWGSNRRSQHDIPPALQGRVARVHAEGHSTWAVDVDGRLHGWGVTGEADSLPFELSDEVWLEFATRMWGKTKQRIYPEHIRKSAAFKAIRAMHKVAGE